MERLGKSFILVLEPLEFNVYDKNSNRRFQRTYNIFLRLHDNIKSRLRFRYL